MPTVVARVRTSNIIDQVGSSAGEGAGIPAGRDFGCSDGRACSIGCEK
jgi:hypothetical protein